MTRARLALQRTLGGVYKHSAVKQYTLPICGLLDYSKCDDAC